MDHELTRYLNDHLAGASGALILIDDIAEKHGVPEAKEFFRELKAEVSGDRALLERLLEEIGQSPSTILKVAGKLAARVGGIKLMWEQVEPGKLGMLEAIEMLAIGIQGKRLLWEMLARIAPGFPEWWHVDFPDLAMKALDQRDAVEVWRLEAGADSLLSAERKSVLG